jgi:3-oxoacyl-[acyl-carrier protein] reductase
VAIFEKHEAIRLKMDEFVGKVALITGAGRGLGRELALAFASFGASVAANDINPINLDGLVGQVLQKGGTARPYVFDLARRMPVEGMVAQVLEHFGRIDILINHACVCPKAHLLDMDEWDFHRTLDVNLGAAFFCMQQVGRSMRQLGGGTMVNLISAPRAEGASPGFTAYIASQAALACLTRAAALELAAYDIHVNAVCHGSTAIGLCSPPDWKAGAFQQWQRALSPGQLAGLPEAVSLVLFLCSQAASSISGQVF